MSEPIIIPTIEEENKEGIEIFSEELDMVKDLRIKNVAIKILKQTIHLAKARTIKHNKKVANIAAAIGAARGYTGLAVDVLISAALLHDIYKDKKGEFHPFYIRLNHRDILSELEPAVAETLCSIIEGHEGFSSLIPKIASKEGTIEQVLCDANSVARLDL